MNRTIMLALLLAMPLAPVLSEACTTIIVGKQATSDGSIIIARNEDSGGPNDAQNMFRHKPRREAGTFVSNSITNTENNTFTWKLPPNALGYVAFPNWESMGKQSKSFEETGVNDRGVSLSATETIFSSEKALKADPYLVKTGLTEDSITSVVLPYATSAKEGVRILGAMIEKAGAGEGFGVAFSDRNEAWYLENGSGHHWLAARIPDDAVFFSANQGRLQQAYLDDPMNYLSSPGLMDFVVKNGLHDPAKGEFNFFKSCMADTAHDKTYNYPRVRELLKIFANINYEKDDGLYPVFVKPSRKVTVQDVAKALRNHYNGTAHDPYINKNPKEPYRPISVMRASLSHITQTRPELPDDLSVIQYIALGMTDLSAYVPFYKGISDLPKGYQGAKGKADDQSLFWKYRKLQAMVLQDYTKFAPLVHKAVAAFEKDTAARKAVMEKSYLSAWRKDGKAASALISNFTNDTLARQDKMLKQLTDAVSRQLGMQNFTNQQFDDLINKTEKIYHFHGA